MRRFADLFDAIDRTTSTSGKVDALAAYFATAPPADAAWALYFLTGRRLKRFAPTRHLATWMLELTGLPEWMLGECYGAVGDFAEVIALVLDQRPLRAVDDIEREEAARDRASRPQTLLDLVDEPAPVAAPADPASDPAQASLREWIEERILPLRNASQPAMRRLVCGWWTRLERRERFLLNKLLTGEFRVGVSQTLVVRGLAAGWALPVTTVEHRLMGQWEPSATFFERLVARDEGDTDRSRPYPFLLASPLEQPVEALGPRSDWLVEWKWDGIRAQLVKRGGDVFLWSRGEELVTDRFPDVVSAAHHLPDGCVLDGELLPFRDARPLPFSALQRRIGRERRVAEVAGDVPVVYMVFDVLELGGDDIRSRPLAERRAALDRVLSTLDAPSVRPSELVDEPTWERLAALRAESRARGVEGFMLKRSASAYGSGRRGNDWWKWKIDPYTVDAVLIYAQPGSGRRANLFTDYTFGVWQEGELVPFAKAYSGLSDDEIAELDRWVRRHTVERFGPVSAVEPVHVFELGFEAIARSGRHRAGIAVRFPRILRWRRDKPAREADTLEAVEQLLPEE